MQTRENDTKIIAALNDRLRQTFTGGKVMATCGVNELSDDTRARLFTAIQSFDNFGPGNDPYGEHDFGKVVIGGQDFFWKIDYYDHTLNFGSENPANPSITTRVLTIMLASEY